MSTAIYRSLDRAALDRQLNLRQRWPEHADFFARWAADSAAARARLAAGSGARLDLAYGGSPGETLDLFPAPGPGPAPLVAFIHGGYWQSLDKGDFSFLAPPCVAAGIAFASLNYDLAPKAGIGDMVAQVRRALAWLYRNGADHNVDPGRLVVAGHSAGGHLALMLAATDWAAWPRAAAAPGELPADLVRGAVSVSGIYELAPLRLSYQQEVLKLDPATVAAMSPLRRVPARAGPLVCAVGSEETEEFLLQQEELVAAWRARGLEVREVALPGRTHFSAVDALGEPDHPLFAALRDLALARP